MGCDECDADAVAAPAAPAVDAAAAEPDADAAAAEAAAAADCLLAALAAAAIDDKFIEKAAVGTGFSGPVRWEIAPACLSTW